MATIIKRKKKYSVVYRYQNEKGEEKQKWETFGNHKEALKRKNEIEYELENNIFITPTKDAYTIRELFYDFVLLYGKNNWALSTYASNKALIDNYINPKIGDLLVKKITARTIEEYYTELKSTPAVVRNGHKKRGFVSANIIHEIHKILRCAFNQAVKWEMLKKNPVANATKPKVQYKKRAIWTLENIKRALENCDDIKLALALQLAFVCTMRIGEIVGLQWDSVDISEKAIENDAAYIYVHQELDRVSREAMEELDNKDIKFIFPALKPGSVSRLVLKTPKTESSVRKIYIPKTLAYILKSWKDEQAELKDFLQNDYMDYNLVVTLSNGRPVEHRLIDKAMRELAARENLPTVVFHSLRHSSTTYKLKLTNGAMKDLQHEGGWSTIDMITKVYAHSIEEDRKSIAQNFDEAFYGGIGFDNKKSRMNENVIPDNKTNFSDNFSSENPYTNLDINALVLLIQSNPQLAQALQSAVKSD